MDTDAILICVSPAVEAEPPASFAASELRSYLHRMTERPVYIVDDGGEGNVIRLDLSPSAAAETMDDGFDIEVVRATGTIDGNNPRSLLFGVYRYLYELGCRWVRPGPDGEVVPTLDIDESRVVVSEQASYRHRGICIEGASGLQNVRDLIDWLPKLALNSYFVQFRDPYVFLNRWYGRSDAGANTAEPFTPEISNAMMECIQDDLDTRGLIYHGVGHGWTADAVGIDAVGWTIAKDPVPDEVKPRLALVNGVRDLWDGIPLNTELCYSQGAIRTRMATEIAAYAKRHPEIDVLHVWLSDGINNHCECVNCMKVRPSDWYIMVLNEVDRIMTSASTGTKVAFLAYHQLLWAPATEHIENPDRFIFMFAPIRRDYRTTLTASAAASEAPPYLHNASPQPHRTDEYLAVLSQWRENFDGDSFDFDYHFMWFPCFEPGQMALSRVVHSDVRALANMGLNGLISCQPQRAFFPHGFGMTIMARTLWDADIDYELAEEDYFQAAFGDDSLLVRVYLNNLSQEFQALGIDRRGQDQPTLTAESIDVFQRELGRFLPVINRNLAEATGPHRISWHHLRFHADLWMAMERVLQAVHNGVSFASPWTFVQILIQQRYLAHQGVFDATNFVESMDRYLRENSAQD